jgi:hypothetical protein
LIHRRRRNLCVTHSNQISKKWGLKWTRSTRERRQTSRKSSSSAMNSGLGPFRMRSSSSFSLELSPETCRCRNRGQQRHFYWPPPLSISEGVRAYHSRRN